MPRQTWTSQLALSPKQRRREIVDIIAAGLVGMPDGLDLPGASVEQPVHTATEESAESAPQVADRP